MWAGGSTISAIFIPQSIPYSACAFCKLHVFEIPRSTKYTFPMVRGCAEPCRRGGQGWQWLYSYFAAVPSPALSDDSSYVDSSLAADRQQELLKAFLAEDKSKINPKKLVTSSDGSQMVTVARAYDWTCSVAYS